MMKISAQTLWDDLLKIREQTPLIHNITNYVVMNFSANALLALGASPVMAHAKEELTDIVSISKALVINIGTLSGPWAESMMLASQFAKSRGIPVVFDPVGAGASHFRTDMARQLLEVAMPTIIRGNSSEIQALISDLVSTKGVDSTSDSDSAIVAAEKLSQKYGCVVVTSGETDIVTDGSQVAKIKRGHKIMTKVTGMGCVATTFIAAFAAINPVFKVAAAHAMAVMGVTGELAQVRSGGPGSFQTEYLDVLSGLNADSIGRLQRVSL